MGGCASGDLRPRAAAVKGCRAWRASTVIPARIWATVVRFEHRRRDDEPWYAYAVAMTPDMAGTGHFVELEYCLT
jgi:hypothetical protein